MKKITKKEIKRVYACYESVGGRWGDISDYDDRILTALLRAWREYNTPPGCRLPTATQYRRDVIQAAADILNYNA